MSTLLLIAPDLVLPVAEPPVCVSGAEAADPPVEPGTGRRRNARGSGHRPGPGCPCGCTFDSQRRRCIEPWNPPADGNDLGPLYFG